VILKGRVGGGCFDSQKADDNTKVTDDTNLIVIEAGEDSRTKSEGGTDGLGPAGAEGIKVTVDRKSDDGVKLEVDRKSDDGVNDAVGEGD
jgi:hypothetical protein